MERKVEYDELISLINQKMSNAEIARKMGVNKSTITRAVQLLKKNTNKMVVVMEKSSQWRDMHFRLFEEFMNGFSSVTRLMNSLESYIYDGDRNTFKEMQREIETKSVEKDGVGLASKEDKKRGRGRVKRSRMEKKIERFDFSVDPKALLVKVQQVREEYVMDALEILKEIMDVEKVAAFLNDMIGVICRRDPSAKHDIEEALKQHQLIRSIVTFDPGDQTDVRDQGNGGLRKGDQEEVR